MDAPPFLVRRRHGRPPNAPADDGTERARRSRAGPRPSRQHGVGRAAPPTCRPTATSTPPAHVRAGRGCAEARRRDRDEHPRDRDPRRARPGHGRRDRQGRDRGGRRRQRRRHVRPGDRRARRRQRPDRPDGPPVPLRRRSTASRRPAAAARPGQPRLLPRGGRRAVHGRLRARPGAVVARRHPGRLQRQAARGGLAALRADHGGRDAARAGARRRRGRAAHQRPGGLHAGQRVHPGPIGRPRLLRRGRVLRPRDRRRRRDRAAGRGVDRRRRAELDLWKMDIRRFGAQYRSRDYTLARTIENYATYYDIHYPNRSARPAGRCASRRPTRASRSSARPSARSPAGSGRTGSSRTPRPATRRCARAAGPASTGRRRSAPSTVRRREAAALFDETSFAKIEVVGPGAAAFPRAAVRQRRRPRRRADHLHADAQRARRDRVRLHRDPARGGPLPDRHRHRVRPARPGLAPRSTSRTTARSPSRRHVGACLLRALGPAGARHPRGRSRRRLSQRRVPVPARARDHRRLRAGLALRVTYVGELGWELYCPRSSALRLWDTLWEAGREHGLVAGGYRAIDALRLEKGYRVWSSRHHARTRRRTRPASGSRSSSTRGASIGRDALVAAGRPERASSRCLILDDPRSVASATSRSGSAARSSAGSRAAATATRSSARSPTPTCPAERRARHARSRSRSSASGSASRSRPSRCTTRAEIGSGASARARKPRPRSARRVRTACTAGRPLPARPPSSSAPAPSSRRSSGSRAGPAGAGGAPRGARRRSSPASRRR